MRPFSARKAPAQGGESRALKTFTPYRGENSSIDGACRLGAGPEGPRRGHSRRAARDRIHHEGDRAPAAERAPPLPGAGRLLGGEPEPVGARRADGGDQAMRRGDRAVPFQCRRSLGSLEEGAGEGARDGAARAQSEAEGDRGAPPRRGRRHATPGNPRDDGAPDADRLRRDRHGAADRAHGQPGGRPEPPARRPPPQAARRLHRAGRAGAARAARPRRLRPHGLRAGAPLRADRDTSGAWKAADAARGLRLPRGLLLPAPEADRGGRRPALSPRVATT